MPNANVTNGPALPRSGYFRKANRFVLLASSALLYFKLDLRRSGRRFSATPSLFTESFLYSPACSFQMD